MNILTVIAAATISLSGEWTLGFFEQPDDGAIRKLPVPSSIEMKTVKATVPGNCELDLIDAGLLPPAEIGLNAMALRPYEGYQWLYTKKFPRPLLRAGQRAILRFEGVDTLADVFLNGQKIGATDNMFIAHRFDVTKTMREGDNTVQVLIRSVMCEAQHQTLGELGQANGGGGDMEPFRKAAHMGGWDIFPRVFAAGLWRDVALDVEDAERIDQPVWIVRELGDDWVDLQVTCRVQAPFRKLLGGYFLRWTVSKDGKPISTRKTPLVGYQNMTTYWRIEGVEKWWPKGMGRQNLYDGVIELVDDDGRILAKNSQRIGFRTISLERDDVYDEGRKGQFLFKVNGEPCYIRGSNWVPLDAFHGRDGRFLRPTIEMWDDLNCNMVRIWGGGVYEPDSFFDYCDEHGIMVWQDFMTACTVYPQSDAYAKATELEVREVVMRLRNHASLALWSGNNENDGAFHWRLGKRIARNPNEDRNSRSTIPKVLFEFDVTRPYLPSSPYYSPDVVAGKAEPSEEHLWGVRAYYKEPFYTNSTCWFASEMGYHGCPCRKSLERMMTPSSVYPWKKITGDDPKTGYHWNDEWKYKASDWQLERYGAERNSIMANQVKIMFGKVPVDLDEFIDQSQFVQAEAMKTFCELFRSRKFTRFNGLIWWNVRDGWPQISDAVVDYYGEKKRAYYALKNAQKNHIVCVVDDHTAWAINDERRPIRGNARFTDVKSGRCVLEEDFVIPSNGKVEIGKLPFVGQGVIKIDAKLDGETYRNHFLYGEPPFDWITVKELMKEVGK